MSRMRAPHAHNIGFDLLQLSLKDRPSPLAQALFDSLAERLYTLVEGVIAYLSD